MLADSALPVPSTIAFRPFAEYREDGAVERVAKETAFEKMLERAELAAEEPDAMEATS